MYASAETLMRQAPMTVDTYLRGAIESIDRQLGKGYAAKHPELIASFIQACAADFSTGEHGQHLHQLGVAVHEVAQSLEGLPAAVGALVE